MARPSFELAFDEEIIEAPPKKIFRFASVDEASMDKLDMKRVPDATRKTTDREMASNRQTVFRGEANRMVAVSSTKVGSVFDKCRPSWNFVKE